MGDRMGRATTAIIVLALAVAGAVTYVVAGTVEQASRPTLSPVAAQRMFRNAPPTPGKPPERHAAYTRTYQPPERMMAAKTGVVSGDTWSCVLEALNQDDFNSWSSAPLAGMSAYSIGGTCGLVNGGNVGGPSLGGALITESGRLCYPYYIQLTAGGTTQYLYYLLDIGPGVGPPPQSNDANPAAVLVTSMDVRFELSLQGFYIKGSRTAAVYPDRQTMHWSDLDGDERWYAGPTTTADVTVTGPDGRTLTSSTPLYITEGDELELGSGYAFGATIGLNRAPNAGTPYGTIRDITWGSTPLSSTNVSLYSPGDTSDEPSSDGWSRTQTTTACYRVYGADSVTMEGVTARGSASPTYQLSVGAPYIITVQHAGRLFDAAGPAPSPPIQLTSAFIEWVLSGGTYVSQPIAFTGSYSASQYSDSRLYTHEWQTLSGNTITARVTSDWRDDNGWAVGNDVTGGDAEELNDQLCGVLMHPLTATDRTSDPYWTCGLSLEHLAERDVNDTAGQTQRASWWLGGVGVDIDPLDNDIWTVTAGALAPAVSRSLRSHYLKRMARLGDWEDDPEEEHNRDWPITLKANLGYTLAQDDPDWYDEPLVQVSGAGMAGVDGDYSEWGSSGGQQQYRSGGTYIRYDRTAGYWIMTDATLTVYYQSETLEGQWDVNAGTAPGPTVELHQLAKDGDDCFPLEDVTNHQNYRYYEVCLIAPVAGDIEISLDYRVPAVSDPNYTGFDYEFGEYADLFGGWSYTDAEYRLTWTVPVSVGGNTILLDTLLNEQEQMPSGPYRIEIAESVAIALPANATGSGQQWELQSIKLVEDTGEPGRAAPDTHLAARYKPAWSWLDPAYRDDSDDAVHAAENWFGFGAVIDGKKCLEQDYGYDEPHGRMGREWGMPYIQRSQHNPLSEATGRLDYAKSLGRWHNEMNLQEGFLCTWPTPTPEESAHNQDSDGNQVDPNLYWWDMEQSNEAQDWDDMRLALCAGSLSIAAGIPYVINVVNYPGGKVHGVAFGAGHSYVARSQSAAVELYGSDDGGPWTLLETMDTDEHGRFVSQPVRETDWRYRVGTDGQALTVINRSYTLDWIDSGAFNWEGYLDLDECGLTWLVAVGQGILRVYWIGAGTDITRHQVTPPSIFAGHSRPSIAVAGGALYVAATLGGDTVIYRSWDRGETWALVSTDLGDDITLGTIAWRETGEVMLCGVDANGDVLLRMASDGALTRDDLTPGVDELTIATGATGLRSCVIRQADGSIVCAVDGTGQVSLYRCRDFQTGFAAV